MLFKNLISAAYRILIFPWGKNFADNSHQYSTSFNHLCMSRPNKRKFLCWQIFHIVDRFHAAAANFTQRRITPRVQNKRKTATNKSRYTFSKHKNQKQRPRDRMHSSKEELFYCDFHIKNRLQIKFTVFPTNNQP